MEMISKMYSDKDIVEVTFNSGEHEVKTEMTKKQYKDLIKDKR